MVYGGVFFFFVSEVDAEENSSNFSAERGSR
jgi:hypothetical protein